MKLRKMNESIKAQFKHALENEHTILEPTEANALEVEEQRKEEMDKDFKELDKNSDELIKKTASPESVKVKDRKELGRLISEAIKGNKKYKVSRCLEEGYRYIFESEEETLEEDKSDIKPEDRLAHLKDLYDIEPKDLTPEEVKELKDSGMLDEGLFHKEDEREQEIQQVVCELWSIYSNESRRKIYDFVANLKSDFPEYEYDDLVTKGKEAIVSGKWEDYLDTGNTEYLEDLNEACSKELKEESNYDKVMKFLNSQESNEELHEDESEEEDFSKETFFEIVYMDADEEEKKEYYDNEDDARADFVNMSNGNHGDFKYIVFNKVETDWDGNEEITEIDRTESVKGIEESKECEEELVEKSEEDVDDDFEVEVKEEPKPEQPKQKVISDGLGQRRADKLAAMLNEANPDGVNGEFGEDPATSEDATVRVESQAGFEDTLFNDDGSVEVSYHWIDGSWNEETEEYEDLDGEETFEDLEEWISHASENTFFINIDLNELAEVK